jgi:hypothetical protein
VAGALGADRLPVELPGEADGELADVDHLLDLSEGLGGDLADLQADQGAEILLVLPEQLTEAAHEPAPDRRGDRPPGPERLGRTGDGGVHVGRAVPPEGGQRRPVDR